jgi:hypothetical protein
MDMNLIPLAARAEYSGTQYARIARTEREQVARASAAFGVFDAKGREIGHSYSIDREFWVIDAGSSTLCELDKLEDRLEETFLVAPHSMRNGAKFGALPVASYKRFRTLAEARAYAEQVMTRARKAAEKKASA